MKQTLAEALRDKTTFTKKGAKVEELTMFYTAIGNYPLQGTINGVICRWDRRGKFFKGDNDPNDLDILA